MPIFFEKDRRTGRVHWVVSKYWPDKKRFRRRVATKTIANDLWIKIQSAVQNGTWVELRRVLTEPPPKPVTVAEFAEAYQAYCNRKNRAPEFKKFNLKPIVRILGHISLKEFTRAHGKHFKDERSKEVAVATVNRGLAVLSDLLSYAIEEGHITVNPLLKFDKFPEPEPGDLVMTPEEECGLVAAVLKENNEAGAVTAFIAETGLRLDDALHVQWRQIDRRRGYLSMRTSKRKTVVHIPLSERATEVLDQVTRVVGSPYVFTRAGTREPVKEAGVRGALNRARKKVKLEWVGFHDFRRYRATQWKIHGADVKTIQRLLGHTEIETTMRYYAQQNVM